MKTKATEKPGRSVPEEETEGTRIAREWRKVASALTDTQRMEMKRRAMLRIYGGTPTHAVAHGRA